MHLSDIHIHPIKSCAGLSCDEAMVEARGLAHDRRWMIIDTDRRFLTGRQLPALVRLRPQPTAWGLRIAASTQSPIEVAQPGSDARRIEVTVWKDQVQAIDAGDTAAAWLTRVLGRDVRLVCMDQCAKRAVDPRYAQAQDEVSFADGFPLLLVSAAALDALNTRLATPLPMQRFRPNLVVAGTEPHAEDGWRRIRIGTIEFDIVKPCTRCVFTTVDHERGELDPSGEPLRTLKTYRRGPAGITFGMNLIARGQGRLHREDPVSRLA